MLCVVCDDRILSITHYKKHLKMTHKISIKTAFEISKCLSCILMKHGACVDDQKNYHNHLKGDHFIAGHILCDLCDYKSISDIEANYHKADHLRELLDTRED